jgi:UDP-N-acetylmuramyl pentapeptide phosphotransferase/UDP-N-acetylglucosamine-1-phosphate transferase
MSLVSVAIICVLIFLLELLYFEIASRYNIIDKPNARSSHQSITLRGGGIIFTLSAILWFLLDGFKLPYFFIGLIVITLISFLDDILTLNNKIRLIIHLAAVTLLFVQWNLFNFQWYWLIFALIFVIGAINAYNFMDGINGITGSYSLLAIATLYYINEMIVKFTDGDLLIIVGLSLIVFNFFNFRIKAKCFAGDVGSVSIAFIILFFIGQLILTTHNFCYISLLLVYGLDTTTTIIFRKLRKENIFEAHRSHFYQYLANQLKWNHLLVSTLFFLVQLVLNLILIFLLKDKIVLSLSVAVLTTIAFLILRFSIEGKNYLLQDHLTLERNK